MVNKVNQLRLDLPSSGIDILSISETWLTASTEDRLTTVPSYNLIRHDRQTRRVDGEVKKGGGLGIYYKNTLDVDPAMFKHLNCSNRTLELQWVVITRPNTKRILLGNIYRPPEGNISEAFDAIGAAIDRVQNPAKFEILLMGDFNADNFNKASPSFKKTLKFEAEYQLQQMIQEPTRFSKKNHTSIDLIFSNLKHCNVAGVINYNISDHKLIYII